MAERDNNLYRTYFNTAPISEDVRKSGYKNSYVALQGYNNSELVIRTTKKVDVLSKELAIQSKSLDVILKLAEAKQVFLASIPAIQPVRMERQFLRVVMESLLGQTTQLLDLGTIL
jgi:hypothetical protein